MTKLQLPPEVLELFRQAGSKGGSRNTPAQDAARRQDHGGGRPRGSKDANPRKRTPKGSKNKKPAKAKRGRTE